MLIGAGSQRGATRCRLPPGLPVLRATLVPDGGAWRPGSRVLAFAGIGRPDKFFNLLSEFGVEVVAKQPFPDHHRFAEAELRALLAEAARLRVLAVTTPKDAVRLAPQFRNQVAVSGVRLLWQDAAEIEALLGP